MNGAPLDLAVLTKRTLGHAVLRDDLLRLFREHAPVSLATITTASAERDGARVAAAAHRLKGAAATIAATDLAELARRIEAAALAADWPAVSGELPAATAELDRCLRQIESILQT